jgi:hypothetical protein
VKRGAKLVPDPAPTSTGGVPGDAWMKRTFAIGRSPSVH